MNKRNIVRSMLVAQSVLLIPLIAMLFTEEVDWNTPDFIIVGVLLAAVGFAYELIANGIKNNSRQTAIGIVIAAAVILTWMELAVGIFGSPFAGS